MDAQSVAFDFKKYLCQTCLTIDYEQQNEGVWIRKKSSPTKRKFELEGVPQNLLKPIVEKLDQRSFTRIRRANKLIYNFIEENRESLKIPMYHHFEIYFSSGADGPEVHFVCPPLVIHEKDLTITMDYRYKSDYGSLENFESTAFGKFSGAVKTEISSYDYLKRPMVTIPLKMWKNNPELQEELKGIYHATTIDFGSFKIVEDILLVCEFINFAGLTGKKLFVKNFSDECIQALCKNANPLGLADESHHAKDAFMKEGFETLKELVLFDNHSRPVVSHLTQLEKLQLAVYENYLDDALEETEFPIYFADVFEIIENWRSGNSSLKEMAFFDMRSFKNDRILSSIEFSGITPTGKELKQVQQLFDYCDRKPQKNSPGVVILRKKVTSPVDSRRRYIRTSGGLEIMCDDCDDPIDACIIRCEAQKKTAALICRGIQLYFKSM